MQNPLYLSVWSPQNLTRYEYILSSSHSVLRRGLRVLITPNVFRLDDGLSGQVAAALWSLYRAVTTVRVTNTPPPARLQSITSATPVFRRPSRVVVSCYRAVFYFSVVYTIIVYNQVCACTFDFRSNLSSQFRFVCLTNNDNLVTDTFYAHNCYPCEY